jgi:hypothetical protein
VKIPSCCLPLKALVDVTTKNHPNIRNAQSAEIPLYNVHPLIAEREFARLLRNMSIEYGLMFLTMFEKKGVKIQATMAQTLTETQP